MLQVTGALMSVLGRKAAYLDPGSGSFLLQLLVAGLATAGIVFASQWSRIKRWARRNKTKPADPDAEDEDEDGGQGSNA